MCDTLVALGSHTQDGSILFAKNSDRSPNEPQQVIRTFAVDYPEDATVQCTYMTIAQAAHTNACLLCKPSWIWGAEMGANEYGVHIGNEAVFAREPIKKDSGLTGMDLVRLALERCATARDAVDYIISMLIRYGQGGDCGYDKPFYYHNSFLITDAHEAFVLETAGEFWAMKQVRSVYTISNCLTIENDFDDIHAGAIEYCIQNRRCKSRADFSFAKCFSDPLRTHFAQAQVRRAQSMEILATGNLTTRDMIKALRSHRETSSPFGRGGCGDVCMHAGAHIGASHTTGSMVSRISPGFSTEYLTGMSTPCIAIFKPYWMTAQTTQLVFPLYAARASREAWLWREQLHRAYLQGRIPEDVMEDYLRKRDALEDRFFMQTEQLHISRPPGAVLSPIAKSALDAEVALIEETLSKCTEKGRPMGGFLHRNYWRKKDAVLGQKRPEEK